MRPVEPGPQVPLVFTTSAYIRLTLTGQDSSCICGHASGLASPGLSLMASADHSVQPQATLGWSLIRWPQAYTTGMVSGEESLG